MTTTIAGALLGLAAGDVLGAGYEGSSDARMAMLIGSRVSAPVAGSLYTDDTQQAMVLAMHLLRWGAVTPDRLGAEFATLDGADGRPSVYRGMGPGFRAFLDHLAEGSSVAEAAQASAGNGAAMRVAPVAMRFHADYDRVVDEAIAASLVTHAHPVGVAAAVAVAVAIWASARGQHGADLLHGVADAAADAEHRLFSDRYDLLAPGDMWHVFSGDLRAAADLATAEPAIVAAAVAQRAARTSAAGASTGTDPYAPASVVTALTVAATHESADPFAPVERVVALGGDTDTMGAMAGAVVGARLGVVEWPWPLPNRDWFVEAGLRLVAGGDASDLADVYDVEAGLEG